MPLKKPTAPKRWGDYRNTVDSQLARLNPETKAIVDNYTGLDDAAMFNLNPFNQGQKTPSMAHKENLGKLAAQRMAAELGISEEEATNLLSASRNVRKFANEEVGQALSFRDNVDTEALDGFGAPGSTIDTAAADAERAKSGKLLADLDTSIETGGGAWEQALQQGLGASNAQATSTATSSRNLSGADQARQIANSTAANQQTAAGQGENLRTQTKQNAQNIKTGVLSGQIGTDAAQSALQAGVNQTSSLAKRGVERKAGQDFLNFVGGAGKAMLGAAMSDGGHVPGKPKVFGDDEVNDTVPAILSPGEIVIPRTIAQGPDAESKAAAFVAAIKAGAKPSKETTEKVKNYDAGGEITSPYGKIEDGELKFDPTSNRTITDTISDPFSINRKFNASVEGGSIIDNRQYNNAKKKIDDNNDSLYSQILSGPSLSGNMINSSSNDAAAAAAKAGARNMGQGQGANQANAVMGSSMASQLGVGDAASRRATESTSLQQAFGEAVQRQRVADLQMADMQQKAAWNNTATNMGIDLQNQNALRNIVSGGAQALAVAGRMGGSAKPKFDANQGLEGAKIGRPQDMENPSTDWSGWSAPPLVQASDPADETWGEWGSWNTPEATKAAHGGEMKDKKSKAFIDALRSKK